jgi:RNA polymerase sigma factor (sigma-70 family)
MAPEEIEDLLQRAAEGDSDAWETIIATYAGLLRSVVCGFRLNEAESKDALQTVWLRLIENLHTIRDPSRLPAWLCTTARHVCLETLRTRARNARMTRDGGFRDPGDGDACSDVAARDDGPEVAALRAEHDRLLGPAIATLSERDQALVRLLMDVKSPNYREISEKLGMPIGSIGPTRARRLGRLRSALEHAGVHDAALT